MVKGGKTTKAEPKQAKGGTAAVSVAKSAEGGGGGAGGKAKRKAGARGAAKAAADGVDALFAGAKEGAPGSDATLDAAAIIRLCESLELEISDKRALLYLWRCGAAKVGELTLEEFRRGASALSCNTAAKLKSAAQKLRCSFDDSDFPSFYSYAWKISMTEPRQTVLLIADAAALFRVVMEGSSDSTHALGLADFLDAQAQSKDPEYTKLTLDTWDGMRRFVFEVADDLDGFDPDEAWPSLLDSYVEWVQAKDEANAMDTNA